MISLEEIVWLDFAILNQPFQVIGTFWKKKSCNFLSICSISQGACFSPDIVPEFQVPKWCLNNFLNFYTYTSCIFFCFDSWLFCVFSLRLYEFLAILLVGGMLWFHKTKRWQLPTPGLLIPSQVTELELTGAQPARWNFLKQSECLFGYLYNYLPF